MNESKTLHDIREAEQRTKKIVEQAKADKEEALSKARAGSVSLIDEAKAGIGQESRQELEKSERAIASERRGLEAKNTAELERLNGAARKNLDKAVNFVLGEFRKEVVRC